jgi:6-phosphofructokinase
VRIIGIPKTIDNDVRCTERSIGFDTAVIVAEGARPYGDRGPGRAGDGRRSVCRRAGATRFGVAAADAAHAGASEVMTSLAGDDIVLADLCEVARGPRQVSKSWMDTAEAFLA